MSSPYVKLGNRSLDQWKVTELREELKKRKLTTKGLKEDLVKRLDEAVRIEWETKKENTDNGSSDTNESEIPSEQPDTESIVSGKSKDLMVEKVDSKTENKIHDDNGSLGEGKLVETDLVQAAGMEGEQIDQFSTVETTVVVSETVETVKTLSGSQFQSDGKTEENSTTVVDTDGLGPSQEEVKIELSDPSTEVPHVIESSIPVIPSLQDSETQNEARNSTVQIENDDFKSLPADSNVPPSKYQVSEVDPEIGSQVISDSVSTESVSVIEKNDVINDNVKIEVDVKPEVVQTSLSSVVPDGDKSHPMDVEDPLDKKDDVDSVDKKDVEEIVDEKTVMEETGGSNTQNVDSLENIDGGDLGPPEKLNLDRSSGDDSMEEDVEYNSNSDKIGDGVEKSEMPIAREDIDIDVVGLDKPVEKKVGNAGNETVPVQTSVKRKFHDTEAVGNKDTVKKPRKWNVESIKGSEPQSGNVASTMPKDSSEEAVKERIVPPSSKPATNSLRIDRFVRPFTLKAVQELLGKTGTVNSFWMDQIKTHCYVSYSSVEEAVETRDAVYNLQWPPNGGRLLVAEFVDPQEVKTRTEAPPPSPATLQSPNQPSPHQQLLKQQLPPSSLPPPPPLSNPPPGRERLHPSQRLNLPPPPPLPEKVDPPIVTLDDLFKKTKAIPRIYYLPLSDEQVAAKAKAQGKNNVNQ